MRSQGRRTFCTGRFGDCFCSAFISIEDGDGGSFGSEVSAKGAPDTATAAGYDHGLAIKSIHWLLLQPLRTM